MPVKHRFESCIQVGWNLLLQGQKKKNRYYKTLPLKFPSQQLVSNSINRTESKLGKMCLPIKWKQIADFDLLIIWMKESLNTILSNWNKWCFHRMPVVYQSKALAWGSTDQLIGKWVSVVDNFHISKDLFTSLVRLLDNNFIILSLYSIT